MKHGGSINRIWGMFSTGLELQLVHFVWDFTCLLLKKNKCQLLAKGCRLQDTLYVCKAETKYRHNKLKFWSFLSLFFFSCLPSRKGNDRGRLLVMIDSQFGRIVFCVGNTSFQTFWFVDCSNNGQCDSSFSSQEKEKIVEGWSTNPRKCKQQKWAKKSKLLCLVKLRRNTTPAPVA